jgi:hypothetical protein
MEVLCNAMECIVTYVVLSMQSLCPVFSVSPSPVWLGDRKRFYSVKATPVYTKCYLLLGNLLMHNVLDIRRKNSE